MLAGGGMMALLALAQVLGMSIAPYQDISDFLTHHPIVNPLYTTYLACVIGGFYGLFLVQSRANTRNASMALTPTKYRWQSYPPNPGTDPHGNGLFWSGNLVVIFDINNRAFQDHFSECDMIVLPKPTKKK